MKVFYGIYKYFIRYKSIVWEIKYCMRYRSIMWFWRIRCRFCPLLALVRCAWEKKQLPQSKSIFTFINPTLYLSNFSQFLTNHMFTKLASYIHVTFHEYFVQYNANIMLCSCQKKQLSQSKSIFTSINPTPHLKDTNIMLWSYKEPQMPS